MLYLIDNNISLFQKLSYILDRNKIILQVNTF